MEAQQVGDANDNMVDSDMSQLTCSFCQELFDTEEDVTNSNSRHEIW